MRKELFAEILKHPHETYWVDNYDRPRSLRLVFDFEYDEPWPDALYTALEEQKAGKNGGDSTFISMYESVVVHVDVSKKFEKEFNLGWTGMSE